MLNTVTFAVVLGITLAVSSLVISLVTMKLFTSPKFLKKYIKKLRETISDLENM